MFIHWTKFNLILPLTNEMMASCTKITKWPLYDSWTVYFQNSDNVKQLGSKFWFNCTWLHGRTDVLLWCRAWWCTFFRPSDRFLVFSCSCTQVQARRWRTSRRPFWRRGFPSGQCSCWTSSSSDWKVPEPLFQSSIQRRHVSWRRMGVDTAFPR